MRYYTEFNEDNNARSNDDGSSHDLSIQPRRTDHWNRSDKKSSL